MLRIRQKQSRSWFNPQYAKKLSYELANRLVDRCRGEKGLFITLTYRPDDWATPQELFEAASRDRHVRAFIRRLSNITGEDLTGRWLCKMEFQQNGNVHWHLVVLGLKYVPHDALSHCWGHGYVWVNRLRAQRLRYLAKYISKAGDLPAFILAEPQRSVKVIRTSPGFWCDESSPAAKPIPPEGLKLPIYISIGEAIERASQRTQVHDEDTGSFAEIPEPVYNVLMHLLNDGASIAGCDLGWLVVNTSMRRLARAVAAAGKAGGRRRGPPGVHLKEVSNPHERRHRWLDAVLEERFSWLTSRRVANQTSEVA